MSTLAKNRIVGTSVPRKEGVDKLRGTARYVDDIQREGMWHGATVRSTVPRALDPLHRLRSQDRLERIYRRHCCRYSRRESHSDDRGRSALPCRRPGESLRRSHPAHRASRQAQGSRSGERRAHRIRSAAAGLHHRRKREAADRLSGARTTASRAFCSKKAMSIPCGRRPRTSSKANTAPARRSISTSKTTA